MVRISTFTFHNNNFVLNNINEYILKYKLFQILLRGRRVVMVGAKDGCHVVRGAAGVVDGRGPRPLLGGRRFEAGRLERKSSVLGKMFHLAQGLPDGGRVARQGQRVAG
jgi:hypothetical protein